MNKAEFMRQLESLLQNISEQERQEALHYYDDYFSDAGPENEQAVIEALGNPARVAENIRRDLYGAGYGDGYVQRKPVTGRELTEYGAAAEEPHRPGQGTAPWQNAPRPMPGAAGQGGAGGSGGKKSMSNGMIILIVILCIISSPLLAGALGVCVGILGALVGLAAAWFAMILGFGVAALICMAVGLFLAVYGLIGLTSNLLAGAWMIGRGLIAVGIGILFMMLTVAMAGIATPTIFRVVRRIFSKIKKKPA